MKCLGYQKCRTASFNTKGKLSKHGKQQCHIHNLVKTTNTFVNISGSTAISSSGFTGPQYRNTWCWRSTANLEFLWNLSIRKEHQLFFLCTQGKLDHFCHKLPARMRLLYLMESCILAHKHSCEFVPLPLDAALPWDLTAISRRSCLLQIMTWKEKKDVFVPLYPINL